MNDANLKKDRKWSLWLYFGAWSLEIIAAMIGLSIGFFVLYNSTGKFNVFILIAILPFIMLSMVELARIPIAATIYMKKKYIFIPILIMLIFLSWETMYIGLNYYNKSVTKDIQLLQKDILKYDEQLEECKRKISSIENTSESATQINDDYDKKRNSLIKKRDTELSKIEKLRLSIGSRNIILPKLNKNKTDIELQVKEIERKINELDRKVDPNVNKIEGLSKLGEKRRNERNSIIANLHKQIDELEKNKIAQKEKGFLKNITKLYKDYENQIVRKQKEIDNIYEQQRKDEEQMLKEINTYKTLINDNKNNKAIVLNKYNVEIEKLKVERDKIKANINVEMQKDKVRTKNETEKVDSEKREIEKEFKIELVNAKEERDKKLEQLKGQGNQLASFKTNENELNDKKIKAHEEINSKAENIPTYWIARQIASEKSFSALTQKDLDIAAFIWFGSLSLVAACAGTMMAFASFIFGEPSTSKPKRSKLRTLFLAILRHVRKPRIKKIEVEKDESSTPKMKRRKLRLLLLSILRYVRKPRVKKVEVEKEVEIEKVIEKVVEKEVPVYIDKVIDVEKVVKVKNEVPVYVDKVVTFEKQIPIIEKDIKYIHVPIPTNFADPGSTKDIIEKETKKEDDKNTEDVSEKEI